MYVLYCVSCTHWSTGGGLYTKELFFVEGKVTVVQDVRHRTKRSLQGEAGSGAHIAPSRGWVAGGGKSGGEDQIEGSSSRGPEVV